MIWKRRNTIIEKKGKGNIEIGRGKIISIRRLLRP
jgi:hypothetical protein